MASSWTKKLPTRIGYCSKTNCARRVRREDNNVDFTHVQPHYYRVQQVEPCHQLGWGSQTLFLSIWVLGAMPKQEEQQPTAIQNTTSHLCQSRRPDGISDTQLRVTLLYTRIMQGCRLSNTFFYLPNLPFFLWERVATTARSHCKKSILFIMCLWLSWYSHFWGIEAYFERLGLKRRTNTNRGNASAPYLAKSRETPPIWQSQTWGSDQTDGGWNLSPGRRGPERREPKTLTDCRWRWCRSIR